MGGIWVKLPTLLLKTPNPKKTGWKGEGILLGALSLKKGIFQSNAWRYGLGLLGSSSALISLMFVLVEFTLSMIMG